MNLEAERADDGRLINDPRAKENLPEETGDLDTKSAKHEAPVRLPWLLFSKDNLVD
jgi:hypothetical protein